MVVSLPSVAFIRLFSWATEGNATKAKGILLIPILAGSFLFGTLVPVLFYSAGIFTITHTFMTDASHPMVYAIIGGLLCLWMRAPSGETNVLGILISVVSYILYMTVLDIFGRNMTIMGLASVNLILAILLPVLAIGLIISFLSWVISKMKRDKQI